MEKKNNVVSSVQKGIEEMGIQKNGDGYVVQVWDGESRYPSGRKKYIREEVDTKKAAEKQTHFLITGLGNRNAQELKKAIRGKSAEQKYSQPSVRKDGKTQRLR